ncbi:MAG: hypothetical protein JWP79_2855, partial [Polaromonas sp.]|nr:hypothetical protein [Polaromonas sp.]
KLADAPPRRDGPQANRFEAARPAGHGRAGMQAKGASAAGPAGTTAMESAFSKLAALKK